MKKLIDPLYHYIHPINNLPTDYDALLDHIANASVVLLGEATHGTHEFYEARAQISKRLIQEKGFSVITIEGDWPDTYRINRYINHQDGSKNAVDALADFKRFPAWMWRNEEMVSLIDWLHTHNKSQPADRRVDMYGLDVYSLHRSIQVVIEELEKIDPGAASLARSRYQCFDTYTNPQEYGYMASLFPNASCRSQAITQLIEIQRKSLDFFKGDPTPLHEKFYLEQNALIIKNAEEYYCSLFGGDQAASWNIRDRHMMATINAIIRFKRETTEHEPKIIIWAHNSHVGDARATQMASHGEVNIGQLAKEAFGPDAISVGFTTYSGSVSAASAWGADVERKYVRPALDESIESFFHESPAKAFTLIPSEHPEIYNFFSTDYLERAIGVIYLPSSERQSHYFYAQLNEQFDAIIHFDHTRAVTPLDKTSQWEQGEDVPETYPFGV
jgi:erythromycin esterase-like protein